MALRRKLTANAQAFFTYAEAYALSASSLCDAPISYPHNEAPIRLLWFHAIELYLKAFLRSAGFSAEDLKRQLGHDLSKIVKASRDKGLNISEKDSSWLVEAYESDAIFQARYLEPEAPGKIIFELDLLRSLALRIRKAVIDHPARLGKIIVSGERSEEV